MMPTQNNQNHQNRQPSRNSSAQRPNAQPSFQRTGQATRSAPKNPQNRAPAQSRTGAVRRRPSRQKKMTLGEAVLAESGDLLRVLWYYISENGENIFRGAIAAVLLVVLLLLQTTFFARFRPFGAIPDLLLSLTVAIGVTEGGKWGAVVGLIAAVLSGFLGGPYSGPMLLPLLYMLAGYLCGMLAEFSLSDSIPVRAVYILACGAGRAIVTAICACVALDASFPVLFLDKVLPEFCATALLAPVIYGLEYLCYKPFHKSRAQRTAPY